MGRIRILVADDHTIMRSGLKLLLEQQPDFNIAEANTGREAADLGSKHHPEVAVVDIGMPQLKGIEPPNRSSRMNRGRR